MSSHVEEYTLIGRVSFQNLPTITRAMRSKENILGCLSNRNKGTVSCCTSLVGCRGYLLVNDCYVSLAGVLIQIQYGSVSMSHQLLRCMGTRLNLIKSGGLLLPPTDCGKTVCSRRLKLCDCWYNYKGHHFKKLSVDSNLQCCQVQL